MQRSCCTKKRQLFFSSHSDILSHHFRYINSSFFLILTYLSGLIIVFILIFLVSRIRHNIVRSIPDTREIKFMNLNKSAKYKGAHKNSVYPYWIDAILLIILPVYLTGSLSFFYSSFLLISLKSLQ